jgi:tetratricopeptide (TPR) repeat protein
VGRQRNKKTAAAARTHAEPSPYAPQLEVAAKHHQRGELKAAEAIYRDVLKQNPDEPDALHLLGQLALDCSFADEALTLVNRAVHLRPRNLDYLNTLGTVQLRLDRLQEAAETLRAAIRLRSDRAPIHTNLGAVLHRMGRFEEATQCHQRALRADPGCADAHANLGHTWQARGRLEEAIRCFQKALALNPAHAHAHARLGEALEVQYGARMELLGEALASYQQALRLMPQRPDRRRDLRHLYQAIVPRWHFPMLNDHERNQAFDRALRKVVRPDSIVLDVGSGSGLLAMMAARAGARHVYTCEMLKPLAVKAAEIIRLNGLAERITVISKRSDQVKVGVDLPERANLLVTETVGIGVISERILDIIGLAQEHLLTPGSPVIPCRGQVYAALIESRELVEREFVAQTVGFDLTPFNEFSNGLVPVQRRLRDYNHRLLSQPFPVFCFDLVTPAEGHEDRQIEVPATIDGTCHGIAIWFTLYVDEEIALSCAPDNPACHWEQAVQLLSPAVAVTAGQQCMVSAHHNTRSLAFRVSVGAK